jgi:hypothetical protein
MATESTDRKTPASKKARRLVDKLPDVAALALALARTYEARTRKPRRGQLHAV